MKKDNWNFSNIKLLNDKYPNIDYGGCGIFSYYLSKILLDKYNINSEIFYIESTKAPGLKPDYDIHFWHIYVKAFGIYIDNKGFYNSINEDYVVNRLSISKLYEMINIPELWNNKFNHLDSKSLVDDMMLLI